MTHTPDSHQRRYGAHRPPGRDRTLRIVLVLTSLAAIAIVAGLITVRVMQ